MSPAAILFLLLLVALPPLCRGGELNLHPAYYLGEAAEWKGIVRHILRLIALEAEVSYGSSYSEIYAMRLRACFPGSTLVQEPHAPLKENSPVQAWAATEGDVVDKGSVLCTLANKDRVEASTGGLVVKRWPGKERLVDLLQFGEAHSTVDQEGMNGWLKTMRKPVFKLLPKAQYGLLDGIRNFHPDRLPTRQLVYPLIRRIICLYSTELVLTTQLWTAYFPDATFIWCLASKQAAGRCVRRLLVEEGDYVKSEQPLLVIDSGTENAECGGIVVSLPVKKNEQLNEAQTLAVILETGSTGLRKNRASLGRPLLGIKSKASDYLALLVRFRANIISRFGHDAQRIAEIEREYVGRLCRWRFRRTNMTLSAGPFAVVPAGRPLGWSGTERHRLYLEVDCILVGLVGGAVEVLVVAG